MRQSVNYIMKPERGLVVCEMTDRFGNRYRGKAVCSGDDVFDETIGKRIAFLRADNKRKRANMRFIRNRIISEIELQRSWYDEQLKKYTKAVDRLADGVSRNYAELSEIV